MRYCKHCGKKMDLSFDKLKYIRKNSSRDFYCEECGNLINAKSYPGRKEKKTNIKVKQ